METWTAGARVGPYELISALGAGGMGEVWKAHDSRLNRIVAIKRLTGRHAARFEQEARAIAALNHPNICQIHDIGTPPDGAGYLVLEYVDGKPLHGPYSAEEAVRLGVQIASALAEAHSKGILHRDLKPGNILVNGSGWAKLLDFGLAKLTEPEDQAATKTIEGSVIGTAAYMAPEQARGLPLDERSDIFSLGAVLYEMVSGRRAFSGEDALSILGAVIHSDPEPLQAPPDLMGIIVRCLRKSPAERFQSVADLRAALESARLSAPAAEHPSIAVLPFANMSLDKEQEFFSDGLAEEIINALAQIPGLKVTARTSAFAFRGKEQDIRKIAQALDVRTILEGSVRRSGNRIRVTAQLINARAGPAILRTSACAFLKAKAEVRAITLNPGMRANASMISSDRPSLKYSSSTPRPMLMNGRAAIRANSRFASEVVFFAGESCELGARVTAARKRYPARGTVSIQDAALSVSRILRSVGTCTARMPS